MAPAKPIAVGITNTSASGAANPGPKVSLQLLEGGGDNPDLTVHTVLAQPPCPTVNTRLHKPQHDD